MPGRMTTSRSLRLELSFDPKKQPELTPYDGQGVTIEGMPIGLFGG